MQFNDTTDKKGLIQDCEFLCGFADAGISGTASQLDHFTRLLNGWYYRAIAWIWQASGTWEFDDVNKTDLPSATAALVSGQQDYSLPTETGTSTGGGAFYVTRVQVKDANGNWRKLEQIDQSEIDIALEEYQETAGMPNQYDIRANSIFLYPAPATGSVTLSGGLKIFLARGVDKFVDSDTTQEPGFPEMFHRILSYGASYDFLIANDDTNKATAFLNEIERIKQELFDYYGDRNKDKKVKIKPRRRVYT